ncbi:HAMP domain-containing protein [Plantactinospora sp. S1510]|uniref:histidine kinase n=1 Tax=Plantactinospora alkalitolerans TaxID=2789879 RepID=A0ABS0GWR8_9ACTN|nr:ATP-binding protein [Plantactinospora alkalitolerans]MBF9130374.1 HAMP domain-containing protein [Plantactinospora alkalitolerans]
MRVRLAALGFVAIYVPVLLLFGVVLATDTEITSSVENGQPPAVVSDVNLSGWPLGTLIALAPVAAAVAWWWAGRAVRPLHRVRAVAEDIEATDLGRRIGLDHGPSEVTALAASFDAMLDRLQVAAETQRRLIEETSHELRLPLSVLMTNAEVVLAHPAPTEEIYRQGLERSRAAADRLQRTIEELLVDARGRARTITRSPTDLAAAVRDVVADARLLAAARRVHIVVSAPDTVVCRVDESTVRRAVSNLLDNAVRHAPPGSAVDVRIERAAPMVSVVVADHGTGVPPEQQRRIFERFWRGDARPGHGLGLPIVSQIAQAHGGGITVTSPGPAGDGAVFRLTLRS